MEDEIEEWRPAQARVAQLDVRRLPPPVGSIRVERSKDVVIGTRINNITVDNREKVKGHLLGIDLVSEVDRRARAVRCSFAVCACWALFSLAGLLVYVMHGIVFVAPVLIDVELSFLPYLSELVRNTSRAERWACALITGLFLVCLALGLYVTCSKAKGDRPSEGPATWYVDRATWLSAPTDLQEAERMREPSPLVIINHSAAAPCYSFKDCAAEMRYIQDDYLHNRHYVDGPYNFAVGTDGRVYEGRGWGVAGAHTLSFNTCALGVGFLGDYRTNGRQTELTAKQVENFYRLLEQGVAAGYLQADYVILGHRDLREESESPGDKLYDAMQTWVHYNRTRYVNMSCQQIEQNNYKYYKYQKTEDLPMVLIGNSTL